MKRRNFLQGAALASVMPLSVSNSNLTQATSKEWYEWRTYEFRFFGNKPALHSYIREVLKPECMKRGVNHFLIFKEMGEGLPDKMHLLISYPSLDSFQKCQELFSDPQYTAASSAYHEMPPEQAPFDRISSSLLLAFDGLPQMLVPPSDAGLFELRIYEGYNEDAVRRKIKMFNDEELDLFYETKLNPVFFGDMVIGPQRPTLVYMLHFKDMAERDANWQTFVDHPEWKRMVADPQYANTVSDIHRIFLVPG